MGNRGPFLASVALLAAALCAPAQAADWIYLQRHDGVRSYSDAKPAGAYTRLTIYQGRPTATGSCFGQTQDSLRQRAALYRPTITKHAKAHNLSPELVSAVMRVESCYDRRAVSRAGARGLMQLMPMTAAQLGVHDSFDPEQNIEGGVRYLARLLARFDNDIQLSLAAYNAGPEAVDQYNGIPPYPETVSYVSRILKLYGRKTA